MSSARGEWFSGAFTRRLLLNRSITLSRLSFMAMDATETLSKFHLNRPPQLRVGFRTNRLVIQKCLLALKLQEISLDTKHKFGCLCLRMAPSSTSVRWQHLVQLTALICLVLPTARCLDGNGTEGKLSEGAQDIEWDQTLQIKSNHDILILFISHTKNSQLVLHQAPDESYSLKKLRQELLVTRQYDRISRPVKNHLTTTKVDMRITINEFVDLDTVNSMLVTDAWFHITWRDEFLSWDPNDYQQLKQVHMNPNEIWKPDIVLINTAYQDNLINIFTESEVLVNSTGDVTWITMGLLRSKCQVWAHDYPFTIRPINCRLTFCSLIYQSHEVNITTPGNEFYLAGPWFVNPRVTFINVSGERYEKYYDAYGTYSFESLTVQLKRRDNAMPMIIRVPTLAAIVLTLCMWFLPINWPVRIHLALVAMLIQLFLILYVGLQLGVNAVGLSRPVSYLRDDLFLTCLALTMTLAFRRLLALADWLPPVPYFLSSLLSGRVASLLCFGINSNDYARKPLAPANQSKSIGNPFGSRTITPKRLPSGGSSSSHLGDQVSLVDDEMGRQGDGSSGLGSGAGSTSLEIPCEAVANGLDQVVYLSGGQYEWMQMIIFCDRVMFVFYALFMIPRLVSWWADKYRIKQLASRAYTWESICETRYLQLVGFYDEGWLKRDSTDQKIAFPSPLCIGVAPV